MKLPICLLTLFGLLGMTGVASALLIKHSHSTPGVTQQSTPFTPAYSGWYNDAVTGPTSGEIGCWVVQGASQKGHLEAGSNEVKCLRFKLNNVQQYNHTFWSSAYIVSGTAIAYLWDMNEPNEPITCPGGTPDSMEE